MISGSGDKTIRQWDLQEGKEIEEARETCEYCMEAVGVSRDGRWVVTASLRSLKVSEVETGIVRTFHENGQTNCFDISVDSTLLAVALEHGTAQIWSLETGKLVAGPFKLRDNYGSGTTALRLSEDSRKLAVMAKSDWDNWAQDSPRFSGQSVWCLLQVWDVQSQKLDVQISTSDYIWNSVPVFWTTDNKSIVTTFTFTDDYPTTIYEFDASTLETVGAPFKGHTLSINNLALSSDCVLLASSSYGTIKLWAFESRQLLASFDDKYPFALVLSPDSRQLAYTNLHDSNIHICDIPADILASIGLAEEPQPSTNKSKRSRHADLLNSDATHRTVHRNPVIIPVMSPIPHPPRPFPTRDSHTFLRFLRELLPSSRTDAVCTDEPRNPLDFPGTSPLPRPLTQLDESSQLTPAPASTKSSVINASPTLKSSLNRISTWWPFQTDHASPAIPHFVPIAPSRLRSATTGTPGDDDDLIRDQDYVSPHPSPNPGSRVQIVNPGQHGSGRFCFCF
jgi:hypothetical protein